MARSPGPYLHVQTEMEMNMNLYQTISIWTLRVEYMSRSGANTGFEAESILLLFSTAYTASITMVTDTCIDVHVDANRAIEQRTNVCQVKR